MKKVAFLIVALFLVSGFAFSQEMKMEPKVGSGDVIKEKSRGADPNIKAPKRLNSASMETQAVKPTSKGAKADARGVGSGSCYVTIDNWSDWYIDCYVDGYFEGYLAPYAYGTMTVGSGTTCLYAVAEFDDGSQISWGPVCKECYYDDFELELFNTYYNWYLD